MENRYIEKMHHEYIEALEEELRKIQVFQRELPLCSELVTQAIVACRQQYCVGQSECSEQTSSVGPVLEEFIPIKKNSTSDDDHEEKSSKSKDNKKNDKLKKLDWLKSAQLWNHTPDSPIKEASPRKSSDMEVERNGGGTFHPNLKKEKNGGTPPPTAEVEVEAANSTGETSGSGSDGGGDHGGKREEREGQSERKSRRCWSSELHRRFTDALQQLGGSHVATPKQIRELMKVDGLTNDEVKSHLQKYRLHTRRPSQSIQTNNNDPPPPHFVVVGGIWVPPLEYVAAMAATQVSGEAPDVSSPIKIFSPIASPPPRRIPRLSSVSPKQVQHRKQQSSGSHSDEKGCRSGGGNKSPATSSSARTTTASPVH